MLAAILRQNPAFHAGMSGPLLSIPYNVEINDSSTMIGRQASAHDFADMIVDEFTELVATSHPLVMSVVLHSFITGVPFRLRAVRQATDVVEERVARYPFGPTRACIQERRWRAISQ